jgi:hypothetical protein
VPYIIDEDRNILNAFLNPLFDNLRDAPPGYLNYAISRIVWALFEDNPCYENGNKLIGVLNCAALEFYRRKLAPYEDKQMHANGDITS